MAGNIVFLINMNKQKEFLFTNLLEKFAKLNISSKLYNITSRKSKYRLNNFFLDNIILNPKYFIRAIFLREKIIVKDVFSDAIETEIEVNSSRGSGLILLLKNSLSIFGFYISYLVIDDIRKNENPTSIIQWGSYLPLQRLIKKYFETHNIKVVHSEFGMMPGTIVFEDNYINSFSIMNNQIFYNSLEIEKIDIEYAEDRIKEIKNSQISNKKYAKKLKTSELLLDISDYDKVIFVAGIIEIPGGLKPNHLDPNPIFSPLFNSNQELVKFIDQIALELNFLVLYKEHPLVRNYPKQKVSSKELLRTTIIDESIDIYSLLNISDISITMGSSVSYLSLILNIPCVNLGKNSASNKGIFIEASSIHDLKTILRKPMDLEKKQINFTKYIAKELKYHMFYFNKNDKYFNLKIDKLINKIILIDEY